MEKRHYLVIHELEKPGFFSDMIRFDRKKDAITIEVQDDSANTIWNLIRNEINVKHGYKATRVYVGIYKL